MRGVHYHRVSRRWNVTETRNGRTVHLCSSRSRSTALAIAKRLGVGFSNDEIDAAVAPVADAYPTIDPGDVHLERVRRPQAEWAGTHKLRAAVLEDAIALARREVGGEEREEALRWINDDTERADLFTFVGICHDLGLDPQAVRLAAIRSQGESTRGAWRRAG